MKYVYIWCDKCGKYVWAIIEKTPVYVSYCPHCGITGLIKEGN